MPNLFYFSDGRHVDLDAKRPTATPEQLQELKANPEAYKLFCERLRKYNNDRYNKFGADAKKRQYDKQQEWRKSQAGKRSLADYAKRYRNGSPQATLSTGIKRTICQALATGRAESTAEHYLGCSIQQYRAYLSGKFTEGMSWLNYGLGHGKWCIDHVKPISFFDLTKPEELKRCFHWTNTQPLWNRDNIAKWQVDKATSRASSPSSQSSPLSAP